MEKPLQTTQIKQRKLNIAPLLNKLPRKLQSGVIYHPVHGYPIPPPVPVAVARRNARERTRVKTVNDSYACLKSHVPAAARSKRMSKVDIIKHSIEYIEKLQKMISATSDPETDPPQHQHNQPQAVANSQNITAHHHAHLNLQQPSENYFAQYYFNDQGHHQQPYFPSSSSLTASSSSTPASPSYSVASSASFSSFSSSPSPLSVPSSKENQNYASEDLLLDDDILDVIAAWQDS